MALCITTGLQVLQAMMEGDREDLCGPKGRHQVERPVWRGGSVASQVTLGGRQVAVPRLRVRSADGEVALPSLQWAAATDPLDEHTLAAVGSPAPAGSAVPPPPAETGSLLHTGTAGERGVPERSWQGYIDQCPYRRGGRPTRSACRPPRSPTGCAGTRQDGVCARRGWKVGGLGAAAGWNAGSPSIGRIRIATPARGGRGAAALPGGPAGRQAGAASTAGAATAAALIGRSRPASSPASSATTGTGSASARTPTSCRRNTARRAAAGSPDPAAAAHQAGCRPRSTTRGRP